MGTAAVCLDQNQNPVLCGDPNCTYGDCGSTATQVIGASSCLDQNQNVIACSDPNCTYGDCIGAPATSVTAAVGAAVSGATGSAVGGNALTTPSAGGSQSGISPVTVSTLGSLATAISNVVSPPPKTSLSLGASGLQLSSAGSLFSNPLMLALLAVIAALLFWGFRKA